MELSFWHLLLLFVAFYISRHFIRIKLQKFPPGPLGVPGVGVLPFLGQHPERMFAQWSKRYGPVLSVRVGMNDMVVLNNYDTIYQVIKVFFCLVLAVARGLVVRAFVVVLPDPF